MKQRQKLNASVLSKKQQLKKHAKRKKKESARNKRLNRKD